MATLNEVFALAMELDEESRAELATWLGRCSNAGIELDPQSVRESNPNAIRALFGMELRSERAPWAGWEERRAASATT